MKKPSILIIDNNNTDTSAIESLLIEFNYPPPILVDSLPDAFTAIGNKRPDLVLMELIWDNKPMGFDLLNQLEKENIPAIIITHSDDPDNYRQASRMKIPTGYIVKPFHKYTVASMIEKVLTQHKQIATKVLFIKGPKNERIKLRYNELIWIEADGDYCHLNTSIKRYSLKKSLVKLLEGLDERFIRIHNSFAINSYYLESIQPTSVEVKGQVLPLGRMYKSGLIEKTNILKNKN